jgi:hypothetical protein
MSDTIWYIYQKADGLYMGSGTPFYDDALYGSTEIPSPVYDWEVEIPYFIDGVWIIKPLQVVEPVDPGTPEDPTETETPIDPEVTEEGP